MIAFCQTIYRDCQVFIPSKIRDAVEQGLHRFPPPPYGKISIKFNTYVMGAICLAQTWGPCRTQSEHK